jgi:hypothetical protein
MEADNTRGSVGPPSVALAGGMSWIWTARLLRRAAVARGASPRCSKLRRVPLCGGARRRNIRR